MDPTVALNADAEGAMDRSAARHPARRIANRLAVLSGLVIVLIVWGGLVRLSGSGLSIPEWPIVNGSLLPPLTAGDWDAVYRTYYLEIHNITDPVSQGGMTMGDFQKMFAIEYIHRALAAIVGIFFLVILIQAARAKAVWARVKTLFIVAGVALLAQAILGGIVVKLDLRAEAVAIHLGTAFFFLGLLLWMMLHLYRWEQRPVPEHAKLRRLGWWATGMTFLQMVSGGLVAGTGAGLMLNTWPKMGDYWVPPARVMWTDWYPGLMNLVQNQVLIQFIHRWLAFIVAAHVILVIARGWRTRAVPPRARFALRAVGTVLALQILLGIGNLMMKVPFGMAFAHLTTGLVLFVLLVVITHEGAYARPAETA